MELLREALSPWNVLFTALLAALAGYWVLVILGALNVEAIDVDAGDADADLGADGEAAGGPLRALLAWLFIGEVPVMVLASIWVLSLWTLGVLGQHYFNPTRAIVPGLGVLAGSLFVSLLVVRVAARPLRRAYALLNKDYNNPGQVVGRICVVTTSTVSERLGQAQVTTAGAPILLNVVAEAGQVLRKGDEAVVVTWDEGKGAYIIAPVDLEA